MASPVLVAIAAYMGLNWALGGGSILSGALVTLTGAVVTAIWFRMEVVTLSGGKLQFRSPSWGVVLQGSLGGFLVSVGLRFTHVQLGPFAAMQVVYDGFVVINSLLELVSEQREGKGVRWSGNLLLHAVMCAIVVAHVSVNWQWETSQFVVGLASATVAVVGYRLLNQAYRYVQPDNRRVTTVTMHGGCMVLAFAASFLLDGALAPQPEVVRVLVGGLALAVMVASMGTAYSRFRPHKLEYLVPVLVYDGLLVTPALLQVLWEWHQSGGTTLLANIVLTMGMVAVMVLRAPSLQDRIANALSAVQQALRPLPANPRKARRSL